MRAWESTFSLAAEGGGCVSGMSFLLGFWLVSAKAGVWERGKTPTSQRRDGGHPAVSVVSNGVRSNVNGGGQEVNYISEKNCSPASRGERQVAFTSADWWRRRTRASD